MGESFLRSLFVCGYSLILGTVIITPAVMIISLEFPRWEKVLSFLALLPYAIPGVVAAVGLLRLYSSGPLPISGTVWLLAAASCDCGHALYVSRCARKLTSLPSRSCSKRPPSWRKQVASLSLRPAAEPAARHYSIDASLFCGAAG